MSLGIDVVVEDADDVRMTELGGGAALAQEALTERRVVRRAQDLDRDVVAEQDAAGTIDGAHAPAGEQLENLVAAVEHLAWREHANGISYDFSCGLSTPGNVVDGIRRLMIRPVAALLVSLACLSPMTTDAQTAGPATARAPADAAITYTLRFPDAAAALRGRRGDLSDGRAEAHRADDGGVDAGVVPRPRVRPSRRGRSRSIEPAGGAAPVKTRKNRWAIETGGAPRVTVRYRVYGREMSVRTNWIESRYALLQGAATYLTLVGGLAAARITSRSTCRRAGRARCRDSPRCRDARTRSRPVISTRSSTARSSPAI